MIEKQVEGLSFQFPDGWPVIIYDDSNLYRNRFGQPEDVKGVDLLALGSCLFMIEAKDFKGNQRRIPNKKRMTSQELALEIAKKIRDTVAVLYGAYRHSNAELAQFSDYLFRGNSLPVKVICVVEEDRPPTRHKSFKRIRPDLLLKIEQKLKYLSVHCNLHCCGDVPSNYGWTVRWQPRP